jgi:hypothetical protein
MRTTISSRCHRPLGPGRRPCNLRGTIDPNFCSRQRPRFVGDSNPALGENILYLTVAQGETQMGQIAC